MRGIELKEWKYPLWKKIKTRRASKRLFALSSRVRLDLTQA
jgi:hypothetical protein